MDKDAYQKRSADRQKQKDAVSLAPADVKELSASEIQHRKEELARLNKEPLVANSIAQAEPAGSMSNTPPNGKPDMSKQPDKEVVKQPATSAEKKKEEAGSSTKK